MIGDIQLGEGETRGRGDESEGWNKINMKDEVQVKAGSNSSLNPHPSSLSSDSSPIPHPSSPVSHSQRGKILIADDEEIVHLTVKRLLESDGYSIDSAYGGAETLELLDSGHDLLVLDIRMPDMDGIEVLREIRKRKLDVEILILTGYATLESATQALNYGVRTYLMKPLVDIPEFIRKVREAIRMSQVLRQNKLLYDAIASGHAPPVMHDKVYQLSAWGEENKRIFQCLMEVVRDAVVFLDSDGNIAFANVSFAQMLSESFEHLLGTPFKGYLPEQDQKKLLEVIAQVSSGQSPGSIPARLKTNFGNLLSVIISPSPIYSEMEYRGTVMVITDVTAINQIHKNAELLANMVENAQYDMMLIVSSEGRVIECNSLTCETFNCPRRELVSSHLKTLFKFQLTEGWESILDSVAHLSRWRGELLAVTKDGEEFPVELTVSKAVSGVDEAISLICFMRDITERKQMEETLRAREERFRLLAESASDAIISCDGRGNIVFWNKGAEMLFGYSVDEIVGKPIILLIPGHAREVLQDAMNRGRLTGDFEILGKTVDSVGLGKDDNEFPTEISLSTWKSGEEHFYTAIMRDITERKRAEEQLKEAYRELRDTHVQLVQAGKMTAMGEMAAAVAHELTQPLLGIKGFIAALLQDMKEYLQVEPPIPLDNRGWKERAISDLEVILQQADRMTKIVNMVRNFARASGMEMTLLDINNPMEDALLFFSEQFRLHNIVVKKNLAQRLPLAMGNANQLQQVFINLITNARDAILAKGGEGQLTVSTRASLTDASILVEFADNGIGADTETASKMFEPFFTTKTVGKGTGIGLSIATGIIEEHAGTISVESKPDQGCRFTIRLPIAE